MAKISRKRKCVELLLDKNISQYEIKYNVQVLDEVVQRYVI